MKKLHIPGPCDKQLVPVQYFSINTGLCSGQKAIMRCWYTRYQRIKSLAGKTLGFPLAREPADKCRALGDLDRRVGEETPGMLKSEGYWEGDACFWRTPLVRKLSSCGLELTSMGNINVPSRSFLSTWANCSPPTPSHSLILTLPTYALLNLSRTLHLSLRCISAQTRPRQLVI